MLKNLSEEKLPTVLLKFNSELLLKRNGFEPKTHLKSKGIIEIRPQVMSQTKETIAKTKQKTKQKKNKPLGVHFPNQELIKN